MKCLCVNLTVLLLMQLAKASAADTLSLAGS